MLQEQKISIFGVTDIKYRFSVLLGQKILIFGVPGIENIDFGGSGDRKY